MSEKSDISGIMSAITDRFVPADDPAHATHRFSTSEIHQAIKALNPGLDVSVSQVFDAMQNEGFCFCQMPGHASLSFVWILKER